MGCNPLIAIALDLGASLCLPSPRSGGVAEATVVATQSAIADVITSEERNRFFDDIYLNACSAYI
jgi:hypothetical protein